MQSYQLHIVSDHLKRRHPYLQPPFQARYDKTQVYKAVFDRTVPKLIQILLTEDLPSNRYTSALITLNQLASDEAQKNNIINQGGVGLAAAYLHCKVVNIRRQAALLLGLLVSTVSGIQKMSIEQTFSGIKKLLFDQELQIRNAISWTICRIVLSRIGAQVICKNGITPSLIQSFLKYSGQNQKDQQYLIIYQLQAFKHLLAYDDGIKSCIGTSLTKRLRELTQIKDIYSQINNQIIHQLALTNLSNLAMNQDGKQQCVQQRVIDSAKNYLVSKLPGQVASAVTLIMFTSINLKGKKQCIYDLDGNVNTKIIINLVKLLGPTKTPPKQGAQIACQVDNTVKDDVKQCLKIISQEEDGFLAMAQYMSRQADISHIDQIFNNRVIIPLAKLLPKVNQVAQPPTLPSNKINDYKSYAKTICFFVNKYPQALQIALNECVDLVSKLIFLICYRGDKVLQDGVINCLHKLAKSHEYSCKLLKQIYEKYGALEHRISKTSIMNEMKYFPDLKELLQK